MAAERGSGKGLLGCCWLLGSATASCMCDCCSCACSWTPEAKAAAKAAAAATYASYRACPVCARRRAFDYRTPPVEPRRPGAAEVYVRSAPQRAAPIREEGVRNPKPTHDGSAQI